MTLALERELEARQQQRARHSRDTFARRAKETNREAALPHGRAAFSAFAEPVADRVHDLVVGCVAEKGRAGPHYAALPALLLFKDPRQVAAVALTAVLDRISRISGYTAMAESIGQALEDQLRAEKLQRASPLGFARMLKQTGRRRLVIRDKVMELYRVPTARWPRRLRIEVGALLLDVIQQETPLVEVELRKMGRRQHRTVRPSDWMIEQLREAPLPGVRLVRQLMVVPPRPWTGIYGGGHLDNHAPLVQLPRQHRLDPDDRALGYLEAAIGSGVMAPAVAAVNALQEVPLQVDRELAALAREVWDKGIAGPFPCGRLPVDMPALLGADASESQWRTRNRLAYRAHLDRRRNSMKRVKIESQLRLVEELPTGVPVWQAWDLDFRGRAYTAGSTLSTQAGDLDRALLSFHRRVPLGTRGFEALLCQAAMQDGCGRVPWAERLAYGQQRLQRWTAVGRDPFGMLQHWRGAKEPWQLLRSCLELARIEAGQQETGLPVRWDQTASGIGHIAGLMWHYELALASNMAGHQPADIYELVAGRVNDQLERVLHTGDEADRLMAEHWLRIGIDREWTKPVVMLFPYGGSYLSAQEAMIDRLEELLDTDEADFRLKVAAPATWLTRLLWDQSRRALGPVLRCSDWLRTVGKECAKAGVPVQITGPSGFPLLVAERVASDSRLWLRLPSGLYRVRLRCQEHGAPLSGRLMARALPAHFVHWLDGNVATAVVNRAAGQGIDTLSVHDCFAAPAGRAFELQQIACEEVRRLHRTDWLAELRGQLLEQHPGLVLPPPPPRPEELHGIGGNPYLFS